MLRPAPSAPMATTWLGLPALAAPPTVANVRQAPIAPYARMAIISLFHPAYLVLSIAVFAHRLPYVHSAPMDTI